MLETLTAATLSEHLNTTFRIHLPDSTTVDLELTDVTGGRQTSRQEQFSIVFRGPIEVFLGQGTYSIEHDKIGTFDLFLVPVAEDDRGFSYQAVFNRLRE